MRCQAAELIIHIQGGGPFYSSLLLSTYSPFAGPLTPFRPSPLSLSLCSFCAALIFSGISLGLQFSIFNVCTNVSPGFSFICTTLILTTSALSIESSAYHHYDYLKGPGALTFVFFILVVFFEHCIPWRPSLSWFDLVSDSSFLVFSLIHFPPSFFLFDSRKLEGS